MHRFRWKASLCGRSLPGVGAPGPKRRGAVVPERSVVSRLTRVRLKQWNSRDRSPHELHSFGTVPGIRYGTGMGSRRWFIYVPEISPRTFLFFFYRGSTGRSWSVRDYSSGFPLPRQASEFSWTATEVLGMAQREGSHAIPTEAHPTEDIAWYQERIRNLNDQYVGGGPVMQRSTALATETNLRPAFPMLDVGDLLSHPKARKTQDLRRMYRSPQSEDWVAWICSFDRE